MNALEYFLFGLYPYICATVFFLGSLLRYDRDQYTWHSDSSQLLRSGQLRWGSNLFHFGVLFLFFGHLFGLLTPHFVYEPFLMSEVKEKIAMISGGTAGTLALIGLSILLHRRLTDPRIRINSKPSDIGLLILLWMQLALGLIGIYFSAQRSDGGGMLLLTEWAQSICTFRSGAVENLQDIHWVLKAHILLGMSIFLIFPFTRLVHVWSGFATVLYLFRPYQIVRSRRLHAKPR